MPDPERVKLEFFLLNSSLWKSTLTVDIKTAETKIHKNLIMIHQSDGENLLWKQCRPVESKTWTDARAINWIKQKQKVESQKSMRDVDLRWKPLKLFLDVQFLLVALWC